MAVVVAAVVSAVVVVVVAFDDPVFVDVADESALWAFDQHSCNRAIHHHRASAAPLSQTTLLVSGFPV